MRKAVGAVIGSTILFFLIQILFSQSSGALCYVNNTDPLCLGTAPCYATLRAAVDAAQLGEGNDR